MERKEFKNIYQKLHVIQSKLIGLKKDSRGDTYEYVSGSKVLEHVKPLMNELGIILKQEVLSIENTRQDYSVANRWAKGDEPKERVKSEILSKVMMRFTWVDIETGEKDENLFGANGQNNWDKGVGSALTYAERYFLLKYFHIATDEDDIDNPDLKKEDKPPLAQNTSTPPIKQTTPLKAEQPKTEQLKGVVKIPKSSISGNTLLNDNIFKAMVKAVNSGNSNQVKDALVKYRLDDVLKYVKEFEKIGFVIE